MDDYNPWSFKPRANYDIADDKLLSAVANSQVHYFSLELESLDSVQQLLDEFTFYPPHPDPNEWGPGRDRYGK